MFKPGDGFRHLTHMSKQLKLYTSNMRSLLYFSCYLNIKLEGEGINVRKRNKKEMRDFYSGCEEVTGLSMPFINEELGNWTTSM